MSAKKFFVYRLVIVMLLSAAVSFSITTENYYVALAAMATAMIALYLMRKQVVDVLQDERDFEIAGKASRYAINIFSLLSAILIIVVFATGKANADYQIIASTLAYSICGLMLLYVILFKYFEKGIYGKHKTLSIVLVTLFLVIFTLFGIRLFSGEDNWICENGRWEKHGHPSSPAPDKPCNQ